MNLKFPYFLFLCLDFLLSIGLKAQDAYVIKTESKTLTLKDNVGLNHIDNNIFKYQNGNYGIFKISCPGKNIAYAGGLDNGLKFSINNKEGEVSCFFEWEESSDFYEIEKVTKVQLKTRAYGSGGNAQVSINGASFQNIGNLVGGNTTVSTINSSGLNNGFTIKYKSNNGDRNPIIAEIYIEYTITFKEPLFYFSSIANSSLGGSASSQIENSTIQGSLGQSSAFTTAIFTATPNSGYTFAGWGTTADATTYESTANPYHTIITNNTPGSTANKTLYAIFEKDQSFDDLILDTSEGLQASIKTYDSVTLNRTISAGLSTIALPFDTTVEALTGRASDKAYTLCNVGYRQGEGYTFYFKEVEGGVLQACKPYVISSASEVVNPQWGQTTIGELTAGEITCGAWSFKANFEAGKSMEGLYGVVNSRNKVMKGGASSTINAFSAYFELNPSAATASTKAGEAEDIPASAIPLFKIQAK